MEHHKSGKENVARAQAATRGLINRALSGKASGRIPYGYARRVVSPDGRARVVPRTSSSRAAPGEVVEWVPGDPREVKTVQRVFELYLSGKSTQRQEHRQDRRLAECGSSAFAQGQALGGHRRPGPAAKHLLRGQDPLEQEDPRPLLQDRGRQRRATDLGQEPDRANPEEQVITIEDHHEAIVDADDFEATQRLLVKQRRRSGKQRQRAKLSPLNGLVRCGCCGCRHAAYRLGQRTGLRLRGREQGRLREVLRER